MTTRGRTIALACLLLTSSAGCFGSSGPPPIYIGHVANLSGADRSGMHAEQGIRLSLKLLADDNLSEALLDRELRVRHADTRGVLDASEAEAARLREINRVVGLIGGATADEVTRLDRAHIPVLAQIGVRPAGASDMVFAVGMRPVQQAFILAKYAAVELGYHDVVVLADERRDVFVTVADAFARNFGQERHTTAPVVLRFGQDPKKEPKWDELARIVAGHKTARAVVFAGKARDWIELRRQLPTAPPLIFAGDDGDAATLVEAPGKQAIYVATAYAPEKDLPRMQAFIEKYKEAFKEEPDVAAALGFESLQLFAAALKQSGPTFAADKLQGALRDIKDFAGLTGTLAMSKDQYVLRPLYVARRDGAKLTRLKRYEADTLP